ncbi:MAG: peptidoglycan-binding protein [Candidatus Omnitrophota bacterium]
MRIGALLVIFLVMLLSGCATTRKGQDIQLQQLHNQINYLEAELQKKDQKISSLEDELDQVQGSSYEQKTEAEDTTTLQLSVRQIQTALKNAGIYKGPIDGKMGPKTKQAIREFQKANGLKSDGIVGRRTAEKLNKYLY